MAALKSTSGCAAKPTCQWGREWELGPIPSMWHHNLAPVRYDKSMVKENTITPSSAWNTLKGHWLTQPAKKAKVNVYT